MGLDLRIPTGLMFSIIGLLPAEVGAVNGPTKSSLDININLWWGLLLLVSAAFLLLTARRGAKRDKAAHDRDADCRV